MPLVEDIERADTCAVPRFMVAYAPDSIAPPTQCALINEALHQFAKAGPASAELLASDSMNVSRVGIYQWSFVGPDGRVVHRYMTIEFCLAERPYNLVAYLEADGRMTARRSHKGPRECAAPTSPSE
jgi:hypothetical protein